jgi:two-component system sensor histidine kinase QseC
MKLLSLTIRHYLLLSLGVILVGLPVLFYAMQELMHEDVDEAILLRKQALLLQVHHLKSEADIRLWQKLDGNIRIRELPRRPLRPEIYKTAHYDSLEQELKPFRELETVMILNGRPRLVLIGTNLVESEDLALRVFKVQALLLLALLGGMLYINRRIARHIWAPFYATVSKLKQFNVDQESALVLPATTIKEFQDLQAAILQLAERSQAVYRSQKQFTENAAHEIRTPLAILQSKLEMLLQTPGLSEAQATLVNDAIEGANRLAKLNKSLLLLTKIENHQFPNTESLDLGLLLQQLLSRYQDSIAAKNISVTQNLSPVLVQANPVLLEVLMTNLLSNAIRHNLPDGRIYLTLKAGQLLVANTGASLAIRQTQLFERFQKDPGNPTSFGLGLAIAKKICDLNGFGITYTQEAGRHLVTVSFPYPPAPASPNKKSRLRRYHSGRMQN